jgi:dihydroorotase
MLKTIVLLLLFFGLQCSFAQQYQIIIKGGHVIDPKNNIDEILDVAIGHGKILKVSKNIDTINARQVINARAMYVVPGLIDMHTHDFYGADPERHFCNGTESLPPDSFAFRSGVTTVVDAGSSGWKDFPVFKKKIIDSSKTRVLAFLNIVGSGMRGRAFEQDTSDMDANKTAMTAKQNHQYIVGIKLAHFRGPQWKPVDETIKAGNIVNIPVMIDFGESATPLSMEELFLKHLRPGDIFTHCFAQLKGRESIVDTMTKKLKSFAWEAKKKGILFDVGYGAISFSFSQAMPAENEGFHPNTISTDMHVVKKYKMKDITEIMSEFLSLGMNIYDVVEAVTWNPAKEIRHEELGNISIGRIADIAILKIRNGNTSFYDYSGYRIKGLQKFENEVTIKSGVVVYSAK